ncbi:PA0069 family radical SAM protein [Omnitrophica bacterium]|nr:PA0069 family radical SAM protein [Candidatus Omnitrophota bacterium]
MIRKVANPPNPFQADLCEYFDGQAPAAKLEVYSDASRSILSQIKSPDLGYRWSVNPYRGCQHGCAYCYARPSHEYLGFGAGSDFETKVVVKTRAPELLRQAFLKRAWKGEEITFSGDTDCYQPLEATYELTRKCLEVCLEFGNPVGVVTKSSLILRDFDLLLKLHRRTRLWLLFSIPFLDSTTARRFEPLAAGIEKRFELMKIFSQAGIETGVNVSPVIPGLNDSDLSGVLERAKACGAQNARISLLRLPTRVKDVFLRHLREQFPLAYQKIVGRIKEARGGVLYQSEFGKRMRGQGPYWEQIEQLYHVTCKRLGLNRCHAQNAPVSGFMRPGQQREFSFSCPGGVFGVDKSFQSGENLNSA